jgi:hypothetical protein
MERTVECLGANTHLLDVDEISAKRCGNAMPALVVIDPVCYSMFIQKSLRTDYHPMAAVGPAGADLQLYTETRQL